MVSGVHQDNLTGRGTAVKNVPVVGLVERDDAGEPWPVATITRSLLKKASTRGWVRRRFVIEPGVG
jgi:hypothetical protein